MQISGEGALMTTYIDLLAANEATMNAVPMFFAFTQEQLDAAMAARGVTDTALLCRVAHGALMLKSEVHLLRAALDEAAARREAYLATDDGLLEALTYELANHEYCITGDSREAVEAVDCDDRERVRRLLPLAIDAYMATEKP